MVILSETPEGLQKMLDSLSNYTKEWKLKVNVQKTKIVVFRNGRKIRGNETWSYDNACLEVVNEFNYLGVLFNYNGKFRNTQKHAAEQGRKALFSISNYLKRHPFNTETQSYIFYTYVNTVLSYGSEIWGFHKATDVEKVHTSFRKKKYFTCE
jgi:hypothetical protein